MLSQDCYNVLLDKFDILFKRYTKQKIVQNMRKKLKEIVAKLNSIKGVEIYPSIDKIFVALRKISKTKVVIIGQDPYHNPGQAMGLSFSVAYGIQVPPSLKNIYKELSSDLPNTLLDTKQGNLLRWKKQGVCLLNAALTVERNKPESHVEIWKPFAGLLVKFLKDTFDPVFVLWGKKAQDIYTKSGKCKIDSFTIWSTHPSPMSITQGNFFGSKPFSNVNEKLKEKGKSIIDWSNVTVD